MNSRATSTEQACLENWWNAFPELRGRRWYSVQIGNSVYVLNLDSDSSLLPGSEQIGWIKAQLAGLPSSVRFVFFNLHHPPVVDVQVNGDPSHNGRPNEHALAEFLAAAPEKSRVRFIVTAGHIHNYERFFQDGIVYLVSGGGGAKPVPSCAGPRIFIRTRGSRTTTTLNSCWTEITSRGRWFGSLILMLQHLPGKRRTTSRSSRRAVPSMRRNPIRNWLMSYNKFLRRMTSDEDSFAIMHGFTFTCRALVGGGRSRV